MIYEKEKKKHQKKTGVISKWNNVTLWIKWHNIVIDTYM